MEATTPKVSIVLPVFEEQDSIDKVVRVVEALLRDTHEILVVYDLDDDPTLPVARKLADEFRSIRLVKNPTRGIVSAIETGAAASRGEYICIWCADHVDPTGVLQDMFDKIEEGYDLVSATRYARGGRKYGGPASQRLLSQLGNRFFSAATDFPLTDVTVSLKMYRRELFEKIRLTQRKGGWALSMEMSIKAYLAGYKLAEVPTVAVDRLLGGESKFELAAWLPTYLHWFAWGIAAVYRRRLREVLKGNGR